LTIFKCWKDVGPGTFTNSMRRKKHSYWLGCTVYSLPIVCSLNMPGCPSTLNPLVCVVEMIFYSHSMCKT
jgi:hypothetical protein